MQEAADGLMQDFRHIDNIVVLPRILLINYILMTPFSETRRRPGHQRP